MYDSLPKVKRFGLCPNPSMKRWRRLSSFVLQWSPIFSTTFVFLHPPYLPLFIYFFPSSLVHIMFSTLQSSINMEVKTSSVPLIMSLLDNILDMFHCITKQERRRHLYKHDVIFGRGSTISIVVLHWVIWRIQLSKSTPSIVTSI